MYGAISLSILLAIALFAHGQQDSNSSQWDALIAAAQQAQASGNYREAAAQYQQATRLQPQIAELWANLGLMQHEAGMNAAAIQSLQHAYQLKPSLYVPNLFLGIDLTRVGKPREAIPYLLRAEKMNGSDLQPLLALGRAYFALADFSRAAQEFSRATRLDPAQDSAWFSLGIARMQQVEADSRRMAGSDRATPYAKALFGESLAQQGRYPEAAALLKEVVAAPARPPCMHGALGFVYLRGGDPAAAETEFEAGLQERPSCSLALLGQARVRVDAGHSREALALLEELWRRDHGFLKTNLQTFKEGMSAEESQRFASFLNEEQETSAGNQKDLLVLLANAAAPLPAQDALEAPLAQQAAGTVDIQAANADYAAGRYTLCARHLAGSLKSRNASALHLLCACASLTGDADLTAQAGATLEALQPDSVEALYWSIGAGEQIAFRALARYEQLAPDSERSHLLLGDIYRQRNRYDDAIQEYQKALERAANDPAALLGLASAYLGNANYEKTIATLQPALQRSPDDPELNLLMGRALLAQHDFQAAEPFLRKSLTGAPQTRPYVHALLGKVYAETGRTQEAIVELKLGGESDQDGTVHYQLARMYRRIGDNSDALAAMEQTKAIQIKRREGVVAEPGDNHLSALDDGP